MNDVPNAMFDAAVRKYVDDIAPLKNIIGAVLTGSAGRGDYDHYSDIDAVVFFDERRDPLAREGKFQFEHFMFDIRIAEFNHLLNSVWSDDMFFAYLNSRIIVDPTDRVKRLLEDKKIEWKFGIEKKILLTLVNLSVIYEFEDDWKGLKAHSHYRKFVQRNDFVSAQRTLNLGLDMILDLLYLLCGEVPPDQKNKIRLLEKMTNITHEIKQLIHGMSLVQSYDQKDVERRYNALSELVKEVKRQLEPQIGTLPKNFYQYYLEQRG